MDFHEPVETRMSWDIVPKDSRAFHVGTGDEGWKNRSFQPDMLIMFMVAGFWVLWQPGMFLPERQNDLRSNSTRLNGQSLQFGMENTASRA
jgi:hypothetical protein